MVAELVALVIFVIMFLLIGNVKKCAVGKHPKSEKHGNTAQFSEVERSGTQKNCGGTSQAACCACIHSRYFTGGSPSGLRV